MERLTQTAPGNLAAIYRRGVFTQGAIWQIGSSAPCEVVLGKAPAARIIAELETGVEGRLRQGRSTNTLIRRCRIFWELLHGQ
jgi:glucose-6-phosphate isomerase